MDFFAALKDGLKPSPDFSFEESAISPTHEPKKNITDVGSLKFVARSDYEKPVARRRAFYFAGRW